MKTLSFFSLLLLILSCTPEKDGPFHFQGNSLVIHDQHGMQLRLTPYGNKILRIQYATKGQDFFPDDHYEMVGHHSWDGKLDVEETTKHYLIRLQDRQLMAMVDKSTLRLKYLLDDSEILRENKHFSISGDSLILSFAYDDKEHFTGLGHGYFGRAESIDLRGQTIQRNYGDFHHQQAPLLVPFYLSSKGYGIFLNSTFPNFFRFGDKEVYEVGLKTYGFDGQMDYFLIAGPSFQVILDQYTQLTGRPRLPQKSLFGLHLSDKGHDHNSSTPSDEQWWREKITAHRQAGFPLDHVVNDNRWRAGGGKRCESFIEWDAQRYPDPAAYKKWLKEQGLTVTLDLNRCIAQFSEGWKPEFNIPVTDSIAFKESAPDLTNPDFRKWFWDIFYKKSLDPDLGYPGDALWIDEFDEMGNAPKDMLLANGRSSAEMRNYWFFLIAKALVEEGWEQSIGDQKRPYVWVRGMTAGAQRFATLWSGDIQPSYEDMRAQIRGMQLAGLSGFPFWGHDAGGFHDWEKGVGPDEELYQRWSMAYGSFSPIWRPHGMGQSRWPLDRSEASQRIAKIFGDLRYALLPYTYAYAHQAHQTGAPIARPMIFDYQQEDKAWEYDLQFMWGKEILVAPLCFPEEKRTIWLPKGQWYNFWNDTLLDGDQLLNINAPAEQLPLFVKTGAIIPMTRPVESTFLIKPNYLHLHLFTGADGQFTLYEDDGISEKFRTQKEYRQTLFTYTDNDQRLSIASADGQYDGALTERTYMLLFHGIAQKPKEVMVGGETIQEGDFTSPGDFFSYDRDKKLVWVSLDKKEVKSSLDIQLR